MEIWGIKICKWIKTLRKSCKMNETFEKNLHIVMKNYTIDEKFEK
jgi:hypothetical protein